MGLKFLQFPNRRTELVESLNSQVKLKDGALSQYALGLQIGEYRGLKVIEHGGADAGYHSYLMRMPEPKLTIAILCNIRNLSGPSPGRLAYDVADLILKETSGTIDSKSGVTNRTQTNRIPCMNSDESDLRRYAGTFYDTKSGSVMYVELPNNDLTLVKDPYEKHNAIALCRIGEAKFSTAEGETLSFKSSQKGLPHDFEYIAENEKSNFERVDPKQMRASEMQQLVGFYNNDEVGTVWNFYIKDGRLILNRKRNPPEALLSVFFDGFYAEQWTLIFQRDSKGVVSGLDVINERVRKITFKKLADRDCLLN